MQSDYEVVRPQDYTTAAEHEKAAMLAEFNGTYELARRHRERAAELREIATSTPSVITD